MTMTPVPPRPRRGLKIYSIFATLLLLASLGIIFFLLMMLLFAGAIAGGGESPALRVQAETVTTGGFDKIAILPISGSIDAPMVERVHNFCEYIKRDKHIKAIVVEVDSPGGTVTASDEIYHELRQIKAENNVKMVVAMRSLAASGGYYLSMAADKLYAEPTTLTGSIGVIWPSFQVTEMMKKIGVKPEFVKSDNASEFKDAGSPFKEMTEADRDYIRGLLNNAHEKFSSIVETGRKGKLTLPIKEIAIGKIWTADDAKKIGLIDDIKYVDEVCSATATDAGLSNPTVIRLKVRTGLFDMLSASTPMGGGKVEVHLDAKDLDQQAHGSMEYRYDGIH